MNTSDEIMAYIQSLPLKFQGDISHLHQLIQQWLPNCKLWFEDGKNEEGKTISNPNIGYGKYTIKYANGDEKECFQIGLSATATGISIYILGIRNKLDLKELIAQKIGNAKVTGYAIKFKSINAIQLPILKEAIQLGAKTSNP